MIINRNSCSWHGCSSPKIIVFLLWFWPVPKRINKQLPCLKPEPPWVFGEIHPQDDVRRAVSNINCSLDWRENLQETMVFYHEKSRVFLYYFPLNQSNELLVLRPNCSTITDWWLTNPHEQDEFVN